jgi:hypothetical protein
MSRGNAFSGVAPESTRCPIVAPAPPTAVDCSAIKLNRRASVLLRQQSGYRRAFFRTGELDGAEGIDGAKT